MSERNEPTPETGTAAAASPGLAAGRHTTLVVGYDDQDASRAAVLAGAELAHRLQATLHVVQAIELPVSQLGPTGVVAVPDTMMDEESLRAAGETSRLRVASLLQASPVSWTWAVAVGSAADVLEQQAEATGAYLIVVGLRERSLGAVVEHLVVGSTTAQLRASATRPLLLVPPSPQTPPRVDHSSHP